MPLPRYWAGSARPHLWILLAASLLLLLASMISAGSLLLSRSLARRPEFATRLALGAGMMQILSQLAAEAAVVATLAGSGGLVVAHSAIRFLVSLAPADIPRLAEASLDPESVGFAIVVVTLTSLACMIMPALSVAGARVESTLREGNQRLSSAHDGARGGMRSRGFFVLAQATVTTMLLAMAVLLAMSYRSMTSAGIGFGNRQAVSMNLALRGPGLFPVRRMDRRPRREFYFRLLNRLRESPGVTSAAAVLVRPLEGPIGWERPYEFGFETGTKDRKVLPKANYEVITPGYFQTVGTPLLEGRDFNEQDSENGERVIIISRGLARRIRAAGHVPLGHRLRLGGGDWSKVIGVSENARYRDITQTGDDIFESYRQAAPGTNYLVIAGSLPARELAELTRRKLAEMDSGQVIAGVATIGELIDANSARQRFNMILLLCFGASAAVLSAGGVYSVVAEAWRCGEREIAVRTALGAPRLRLVAEMVRGTLGFVLAGEVLGIVAIIGFGQTASDLLYSVSPRDPAILAGAGGFVLLVSLLAAYWPAWRASGGDPAVGLRVG